MAPIRNSTGPVRLVSNASINAFLKGCETRLPPNSVLKKRILAAANPKTAPYLRGLIQQWGEKPEKLQVLARLAATKGFGTLTKKQLKVVVDRTLGGGDVDKTTMEYEKRYEMILNDIPFQHQSDDKKMMILSHPKKYAPLTQTAMLKRWKGRYLPNNQEFNQAIARYRRTHKDDPGHRQIVQNAKTYRRIFLEHWYDTTPRGHSVGEEYVALNGSDWWHTLMRAQHRFASVTVACVMDNMDHESCPTPKFVP